MPVLSSFLLFFERSMASILSSDGISRCQTLLGSGIDSIPSLRASDTHQDSEDAEQPMIDSPRAVFAVANGDNSAKPNVAFV